MARILCLACHYATPQLARIGGVNTEGKDFSAFRDRGGKLIVYQGIADALIPVQGAIAHYERVAAAMGGYTGVQNFERLFLVPGMGHCAGIGSLSTGNPAPNPPLPAAGQIARQECRRGGNLISLDRHQPCRRQRPDRPYRRCSR